MAFTYNANPGTGTASERRDAVRLLIGDTDSNDQQLQDAEVDFALSENSDAIYPAAADAAESIAGLYARRVDSSFSGLKASYGQRQEHYRKLAQRLRVQAKRKSGLGVPKAGGVSIDEMENVRDDEDRPTPSFRRGQFDNPPSDPGGDEDDEVHR